MLTDRVGSAKGVWIAGFRGTSRRSVLRATLIAAAAIPAAGCDLLDRRPAPSPSADPLAPLISGALELADRYDAAGAAFPELADRLGPIAQAHRAHAAELARVTGAATPTATSTGPTAPGGTPGATGAPPGGGDPEETVAALRMAEQRGVEEAVRACLSAPEDRAALLGSIAAARASHLEVLR